MLVSSSVNQASETSRLHFWVLWGLLALHLGLRLWLALERSAEAPAWDERFNLNNIASILRSGEWAPANFWYGGLSYLPQTILLKVLSGVAPGLAIANGTFPPAAFALCLGLQAIYGTLSLWLAYRLGRLLFAPWTALAGMALLAGTGRHLHASTFFKPDILLLLLSLATALATLRVLDRPTPRQFSLAGLAGGLATAAKLNGGLVLPPLALAGWLALRKMRRTAALLALAATVATGTYLLWNPHLRLHWRYLQRNLVHYENTVDRDAEPVLMQTLSFFGQPEFHGPVLALVAIAGGALWLTRAWRARRDGELGPALVVLAFPALTFLAYAAMTDRAKANHFLQVLPFTSLWIAYFLLDGLVPRVSPVRRDGGRTYLRRFAGPAMTGALLAWPAWQAADFTYTRAVAPTVREVARLLEQAGAATPPGWWISVDPALELGAERIGWYPTWMLPNQHGNATSIADARLDLTDAEVLTVAELETPGGQTRWERVPEDRRVRIAPRSLRVRGPQLVVLLHPHSLSQSLRLAPVRGLKTNTLTWPAEVPAGALVSMRTKGFAPPIRFRIGGEEIPATAVKSRRSWMLMTERFRRPEEPVFEVLTGEAAKNARLDLFVWNEGGTTPP